LIGHERDTAKAYLPTAKNILVADDKIFREFALLVTGGRNASDA